MMLPVIAITTGEPAGIGPEISIRAAWEMRAEMRPILIGDIGFLNSVARGIDPSITLLPKKQSDLQRNGRVAAMPDKVEVVDCPLAVPVVPGRLDPRNGKPVLKMLDSPFNCN